MKIQHYKDLLGRRQTLVRGERTVLVTQDPISHAINGGRRPTPFRVWFPTSQNPIAVVHDRGTAIRHAIHAAARTTEGF